MEKKEITIYDIAKKLNLSPSTISRGLKGHYTVSLKTQKKIIEMAKAMDYRFNTFAANLRRSKTNTIGVIVPKLNSFFMSQVIAGIEKVINEAGYNLIISQSLESAQKEAINARTMFNNRVDGLLVSLAENTTDFSHFDIFLDKGIPLLFFDRIPLHHQLPAISINNELTGYQVTKHLIAQGAKNIVHITGNLLRNVYAERLTGYKKALSEFNLEFNEQNVIVSDLSETAGIAAAAQLMMLNADAAFVANDACAASCMNEIIRLGVKVPQEMLFAGFNNDMISRNITPPLTTVDYPGFEMGEIAAKTILNHLHNYSDINLTENIIIKSSLIVRRSSLKSG